MIGRKSVDALRREFGDRYIDQYEGHRVRQELRDVAKMLTQSVLGLKLANLMYAH